MMQNFRNRRFVKICAQNAGSNALSRIKTSPHSLIVVRVLRALQAGHLQMT